MCQVEEENMKPENAYDLMKHNLQNYKMNILKVKSSYYGNS
jgi:hypothetical protein